MHILFILENYHPAIGGVETLFKSLIDRLNEKEVTCTIITTRHHDLPKIQKTGTTTIIRYRFWNRYLFTLLSIFPALRFGKKADLIHTTSYNAGVPASLAGLLLKKKVVITFHEVWGNLWYKLPYFSFLSKFLHHLFEQFLLKLPFHQFVAVSNFTESRLIKYGVKPNKIRMIYNGIQYDHWKNTSVAIKKEQPFQFIFYGRLGISKGLDLLLPAFNKLAAKYQSIQLTLVLSKQPKNLLKKIQDLVNQIPEAIRPIIHHELPHAQLIELISSSNCVVIPSYSEGFGFTAVESMALGANIISSGRGALKEVLGGNYIEMKSHDVESLVDAMDKAIAGEWEYREPRLYELKDAVNEYLRLYHQINNQT